jgi:hypothetical protein
MTIPNRSELVDGDSLDGRKVLQHFLGKTADEAYEMYCSDLNHCYTEDIMWMAVRGLEYYLPPAIRYIEEVKSKGDCDFVSGLLGALSVHLEFSGLTARFIEIIRGVLGYIRANKTKFVITDEDRAIYLPLIEERLWEIDSRLPRSQTMPTGNTQ